MGCILSCYCCYKTKDEKKSFKTISKNSSISGIETIRPPALKIKHSEDPSPFSNMSPILEIPPVRVLC